MTIRPIDMQVVVAQQTNVAGVEQGQQNMAGQVQAQALQKYPEKTHEREMQVEKDGESNAIKVKEKEAEQKKKGKKGQAEEEKDKDGDAGKPVAAAEDGKGIRIDVTT